MADKLRALQQAASGGHSVPSSANDKHQKTRANWLSSGGLDGGRWGVKIMPRSGATTKKHGAAELTSSFLPPFHRELNHTAIKGGGC